MIIDFNSFAMVVPHPHRKGTCSTTTSFNIHQKRSVAEWRSWSVILIIYSITPRKLTNVPLKKGPFPKERMNYLPTIIFQGRVVSFFGRSISHIPNSWTIFGPMIPGEIPGDMVTWWPKNHLDLPASISAGAHLQALESSMIVKEKMYENTHLEAGWILRFFPVKNGGHWNKLMLLGERSPHNQKKKHMGIGGLLPSFLGVTQHPGIFQYPKRVDFEATFSTNNGNQSNMTYPLTKTLASILGLLEIAFLQICQIVLLLIQHNPTVEYEQTFLVICSIHHWWFFVFIILNWWPPMTWSKQGVMWHDTNPNNFPLIFGKIPSNFRWNLHDPWYPPKKIWKFPWPPLPTLSGSHPGDFFWFFGPKKQPQPGPGLMWHVLRCGHAQTLRRFKGKGGAQIDEAYLGEVRFVEEPTIEEEWMNPQRWLNHMDNRIHPPKNLWGLGKWCIWKKYGRFFLVFMAQFRKERMMCCGDVVNDVVFAGDLLRLSSSWSGPSQQRKSSNTTRTLVPTRVRAGTKHLTFNRESLYRIYKPYHWVDDHHPLLFGNTRRRKTPQRIQGSPGKWC